MMHINHWGAVLVLYCLVSLGKTGQVEMKALFLTYSSDGTTLSADELKTLLPKEFREIQNDELLDEFILFADDDEDGSLDFTEFNKLVKYITKIRS